MLVLLLYCCVVIPYRIPLMYGQTSLDPMTIVDLVLSGVFLFDIWLNFNTGCVWCEVCWVRWIV